MSIYYSKNKTKQSATPVSSQAKINSGAIALVDNREKSVVQRMANSKIIQLQDSLPQGVILAQGSGISFNQKMSPEQAAASRKKIVIDGVTVWISKNAKRTTINQLKSKFKDKAAFIAAYKKNQKQALIGRMNAFEDMVPKHEDSVLSKDDYNHSVLPKVLRFSPVSDEKLPGNSDDTYTEFAQDGLKEPHEKKYQEKHKENYNNAVKIDFKTGFSADLGVSILRDSFRSGIGKEFFASDVFLVHLKQATEKYKHGGAPIENFAQLPFPKKIHIPHLLNEATAAIAEHIYNQSKVKIHSHETGTSNFPILKGDKSWAQITGTPLVGLALKSIEGYNLLTGKSIELQRVIIYSRGKDHLLSLTLIT